MNEKTKPGFIKSAVQTCARWAGIPVDAGDGSAYNLGDARLYVRNLSGQCVNESTVLSLSSVWACVSLLSDTISTLPIGFYRRTASGRELASDHDLYRILKRQPNDDMTSAQFIGATVANMLLRGVAYWEKDIVAGRLVGLTFLPTARVSCSVVNGKEEFRYTPPNGKQRVLSPSTLVRIPAFSLDGIHGLSAIAYGAQCFGAAQAAEQAAAGTFSRGLLPTTFFKYPNVLRKEQREDARRAIGLISGAVNAGEPVILEAGMEAGTLGISPEDAQLLESRAFSVEEVCSWFRVQPFMIGRASQGQTNWGTGIEQQMIGFVTFTLAPWIRRIEQAIEKNLLAPNEQSSFYAEFALEGLLRGDSASRREFYASALQNGWLNRNTVRSLENQPPIDGGDVYTVQSNLIPIGQLGAIPKSALTVREAMEAYAAHVRFPSVDIGETK
jgi:HK97 family phage portal protein